MERMNVGVVGLAVMGQNLVLNIEHRGYSVRVYNRTEERTQRFIEERAVGKRIAASYTVADWVNGLESPRKILLMVKAGAPTDAMIKQILPLLEPGDVVMDGGNAHYADTERRARQAAAVGVEYLGVGVSGGEYGALHGPSIMAGGSAAGYESVKDLLLSIAAQGVQGPCCDYFGPGSAGHYVKMVHNGIEYAIMQVLAETYDLMKRGLGLSPAEMADELGAWNRGVLESYLVEITEKILRRNDPDTGTALVERIRDTASQKGTGKWSSQSALDLGAPSPTIAAAVFGRIISALKPEREAASCLLAGPEPRLALERFDAMADLRHATLLTVIAAYAQGIRQIQEASKEKEYGVDLSAVARVWMDGCIIRARLLGDIAQAFSECPDLPLLLLAEPFRSMWENGHASLRRVACAAHGAGIPVPAMSSTLDFVDAYRSSRLPANLLQAQRDFFGAHTYERIDREGTFHTDWEAA